MKKRDLDYVVITLLIGSTIYVVISGAIADAMGLHHFGFHSQVGYLWVSLAVIHLIQTWARVKAFVRQRFQQFSTARPKQPTPATSNLAASVHQASPVSQQPQSLPAASRPKKDLGRRYLLLAVLAIATGIGFDRLVTPSDPTELAGNNQDLGLLYHRWSQPGYGEAIDTLLNWGQQPSRYKTYADVPIIDLPSPASMLTKAEDLVDVMTVMTHRRSRRTYNTQHALSLDQLSQLLHLAHGITWKEREFRTVPSSGALYPLELYPIIHRVEGLEPGLYHHAIQDHRLERVKSGDLRQPLVNAGLKQDFLGEANVCFVVSGIFQRTRWKYHERTYRYVLMEAGHLGQNLYLAATALGLGVCGIGAFLDDPLNQLLDLDGETEAALYLVTVGQIV
ncbi:MAG: SagB/ThcOx family dehydrogenase [Elainellaceae cyanobacterium]